MNILVVLGRKDPCFKEEYVKKRIEEIIGNKKNLMVKVYENNAHHVYDDELNDIKEYILNKLI